MGNSESVDADTQGSRDTTNKQETIEKISKNASATDLDDFVDSDREEKYMPRFISNEADILEKMTYNNARITEDSGNVDLTRREDGSAGPIVHSAPQPTKLEHTSSKQAVVEQLHHIVDEWYLELTDNIIRTLMDMETNSLNALVEQPRLLKKKVDEVAMAMLLTRNSEDGQNNIPIGESQQLEAAMREDLGEKLCETIAQCRHPTKAEKLVGMFLELDYEDLKVLARNTELVKEKVQEALCILESSQAASSQINLSSDPVEKEGLGDQVYEMVAKLYPEHADKVTGMLLEMDVQDLHLLVEREELLSEKAQQAYNALSGVAVEFSQKQKPSFDFEKQSEELYKAVENVHPGCADKITGMLLEMDCKCIDNLTKNPDLLKDRIEEAFVTLQNTSDASRSLLSEEEAKESIGELLYATVEDFQPKYADMITGMLLEMPTEDLKALMKDHRLLEEKMLESLKALTVDGGNVQEQVDEKETLGEHIYHIVSKDWPEQADMITGMLLEMDPGSIVDLLQDPKLLQEKVQVALNVLSKSESESV